MRNLTTNISLIIGTFLFILFASMIYFQNSEDSYTSTGKISFSKPKLVAQQPAKVPLELQIPSKCRLLNITSSTNFLPKFSIDKNPQTKQSELKEISFLENQGEYFFKIEGYTTCLFLSNYIAPQAGWGYGDYDRDPNAIFRQYPCDKKYAYQDSRTQEYKFDMPPNYGHDTHIMCCNI